MDEKFGRPLMLVMDVTGSMSSTIDLIRSYFCKFLIRYAVEEMPSRIGFVLFNDHQLRGYGEASLPPLQWEEATDDLEKLIYNLRTAQIYGHGWDDAENIACALDKARELEPEAVIWLITDALPHGVDGYDQSSSVSARGATQGGDFYPGGCPCGKDLDLTEVRVLLVSSSSTALYFRQEGWDLEEWDVYRWYKQRVPTLLVEEEALRAKLVDREEEEAIGKEEELVWE